MNRALGTHAALTGGRSRRIIRAAQLRMPVEFSNQPFAKSRIAIGRPLQRLQPGFYPSWIRNQAS